MPSGNNFMSGANKVGTHGSCVRGSKPQYINDSEIIHIRSSIRQRFNDSTIQRLFGHFDKLSDRIGSPQRLNASTPKQEVSFS